MHHVVKHHQHAAPYGLMELLRSHPPRFRQSEAARSAAVNTHGKHEPLDFKDTNERTSIRKCTENLDERGDLATVKTRLLPSDCNSTCNARAH